MGGLGFGSSRLGAIAHIGKQFVGCAGKSTYFARMTEAASWLMAVAALVKITCLRD